MTSTLSHANAFISTFQDTLPQQEDSPGMEYVSFIKQKPFGELRFHLLNLLPGGWGGGGTCKRTSNGHTCMASTKFLFLSNVKESVV